MGTYSNDNMGSVCEKCVPGKYSHEQKALSMTTCLSCVMGKYSETSSASACVECSAGKHAEIDGLSSCVNCVPQTFSQVIGSISGIYCVNCPVGTYSEAGSSSSEDCKTPINETVEHIVFMTPLPVSSNTQYYELLIFSSVFIFVALCIYLSFHHLKKKPDNIYVMKYIVLKGFVSYDL
jgi:hypothetical protein